MSDVDHQLKALFALDEPPASDPAFALEIARRMQQRRFWLELMSGVPWGVSASAILWVLTPWLEVMGRSTASVLAVTVPAGSLAIAAVFFAVPRSGST